jgi:hypothetical protein
MPKSKTALTMISFAFSVYLAKGHLDYIPDAAPLCVMGLAALYWLLVDGNVRNLAGKLFFVHNDQGLIGRLFHGSFFIPERFQSTFENGIPEKIRVLAVIESEAHFVKVGWKMFCTDFMPRSHNPALKKRESRFNGVRVSVAHNVDSAAVVDRLCRVRGYSGSLHCERIRSKIIGHNHVYILADVLADELCNCSGLSHPSRGTFAIRHCAGGCR